MSLAPGGGGGVVLCRYNQVFDETRARRLTRIRNVNLCVSLSVVCPFRLLIICPAKIPISETFAIRGTNQRSGSPEREGRLQLST